MILDLPPFLAIVIGNMMINHQILWHHIKDKPTCFMFELVHGQNDWWVDSVGYFLVWPENGRKRCNIHLE
jgi:hypothetical protein